ncbi:CCR4-associated factor [Musa troglodytarum]|uniref:CCR4-associated factor n=1 Tax=Musa troglodytarum TaxID=320322 RepID=A0A9E7ES98_9LILI|nr:CCR4-associated factor [Musa troglodytarum]
MELVQLGLTLFDAFGHLPDIGTGGRVGYVWEFNFREFDVRRDPHAPDSIDLLRSSGIDFDRLPRFGIDSGDFAALLCRSGLVAHCRFCRPLSARWIAFHGCAGERHASARHPGRVPRPGELALRRDCGSQVHDVRLRGSLRRAGERGEYARCHAKLGSRIKLAQIAW